MGKAAAAFGAALRVKPILHVDEGRVQMLEKSRTTSKALTRLKELALESIAACGRDCDVAVQHIDALDRADELADALSQELGGTDIVRVEIGAVVGAHVGPGTVSVVVAPRSWPAP